MKWTSAYGVVGMDAFGQPGTMTDAMNERGLYAGLLYMPGFCGTRRRRAGILRA